MPESNRIEFKRKLNDKLERENAWKKRNKNNYLKRKRKTILFAF